MNIMKKKDLWIVAGLILVYLLVLFSFKRNLFTYKFSKEIIDLYFHSQDITHDVPGRVFLTDSQIHEATGYLYIHGTDPTEFNFQHPPFIKYWYGLSILLFNNPFYAQIVMGILLILGTYLLGKYGFHSAVISVTACLFLITDPLFLNLSTELLLDMGQAAFLLLYVVSLLYFPKRYVLSGILLGFAAGSKFWGAPLFFVALLTAYKWYKKELNIADHTKHIIIAAVIFCSIYLRSFIVHNGLFNIIFFELKSFKYWLHHSVSSIPGASLFVFISGYMNSWWGKKEVIQLKPWYFLWPILLFITTITTTIRLLKKKVSKEVLVGAVPILYLLYLGVQAPFSRYFIIILPYLYLTTVSVVFNYLIKSKFIRQLSS
jgi:predicted membrane-bound dolichyl-phosphate-mannose-protein mannosyltransferase